MSRIRRPLELFLIFLTCAVAAAAVAVPASQESKEIPTPAAHSGQSSGQGSGKRSAPRKSVGDAKSVRGASATRVVPLPPGRVVDVLRSVADDAKNWTDAVSAADVQAQVADLIWEVDGETARGYLVRAWEAAGRIVEAPRRGPTSFRHDSRRTEARREVLLVARRRVPELAERWLEQMAQDAETEESGRGRGVFDDRTARSTVLLQMAQASVEENPAAAAELAVESLRDGISFGFQNVLLALQQKDFELAQKVFRSALARLRTAGVVDFNELLILSAYLYTPGRVIGANTSENRERFSLAVGRTQTRVTAAAELNPSLALEFLKVAAEALINAPLPSAAGDPQTSARAQISVAGFLIGKMEGALPEQAEALRRRVQLIEADAQFAAAPAPRPAGHPAPQPGEKREEYAERQIDMLEESARRETDALARDIAYAKAALSTGVERYERGWKLAGQIKDAALRDGVTDWLTYRAALHFAQSDKFDQAYELNAKNKNAAQRAAALVVGAQKLSAAGDRTRAAEWLQEARALAKRAAPDETWTRIMFGVVSTYGQFDSIAALEVLSDAIKLMERAPVSLDADERAPLARRFSGFTVQDFTYGTSGFGLDAASTAFRPEQFESVLSALGKITRPESRGRATLALARKHLRPAGAAPVDSSPRLKPTS